MTQTSSPWWPPSLDLYRQVVVLYYACTQLQMYVTVYDHLLVTRVSSRDHLPNEVCRWQMKRRNY